MELVGKRLQTPVPVCFVRAELGDERLLVGRVHAEQPVLGWRKRRNDGALIFAGRTVNRQSMRYEEWICLQTFGELVLGHVIRRQFEGGPIPPCGVFVGGVVLLVAHRLGDSQRVCQHQARLLRDVIEKRVEPLEVCG